MHSHLLDTYSHLDGPIHRLPASAKVAAAVGCVLALVLMPPSVVGYTMIGFVLLMIAAASRIPGPFLFKRLIFLEPFVLTAAALVLLQPGGGLKFVAVATRSSSCLFILILLANTTPFSELLEVLRRARVPAVMITTLALMYRYLFVLRDESARMRSARASRTFVHGKHRAWGSLATVIAQLFVRSTARAERSLWSHVRAGVEMTPPFR